MGQERLDGSAMLYYTIMMFRSHQRRWWMNLPVAIQGECLTTSPDCLLNYNHYDVICHVINVYIYRKLLAPGPPPPSENPRSAPEVTRRSH